MFKASQSFRNGFEWVVLGGVDDGEKREYWR